MKTTAPKFRISAQPFGKRKFYLLYYINSMGIATIFKSQPLMKSSID